jgi:hypothetical protein
MVPSISIFKKYQEEFKNYMNEFTHIDEKTNLDIIKRSFFF